jgi:hypothetical protein
MRFYYLLLHSGGLGSVRDAGRRWRDGLDKATIWKQHGNAKSKRWEFHKMIFCVVQTCESWISRPTYPIPTFWNIQNHSKTCFLAPGPPSSDKSNVKANTSLGDPIWFYEVLLQCRQAGLCYDVCTR